MLRLLFTGCLIIGVLLVAAFPSFAQEPSPGETVGIPWTGPAGITESVQAIMDRGRLVPETPFDGRYKVREEPPLRPTPSANPLAPQTSSWPPADKTRTPLERQTFLSPQAVGTSFLSIQASESQYIPPDCGADIGPTQILVHVNGRIKVFSRAGVLGALNATDLTFWTSVRGGQDVSDPHIRYDRLSKRWIVVAINTAGTANRIMIAVSSDSVVTGTGSFTFFQFSHDAVGTQPNSDTGGFADYPTLGVDANALYIGANIFNSSGTAVVGTTGFVVRKSSVLAGPIVVTAFRQLTNASTTGPWTPQGVDNDDPAASEGYFIGVDFVVYGQLDIRRISTPGGSPTISANLLVTVPATSSPVPQVHLGAASNRRLDGLDDRLYAAQLKKNKLTGVATLWTSHNISVNSSGVAAASNRNGSRWYQIGSLTTTPTLVQSGTLFDPGASNIRGYWIPSVAMSGQGHMALGSSYASTADYAGVAVAGRLSGDGAGTTQSPTLAVVATTAYVVENNDNQRWGDYSQTVVDPNDDMTFWTFQEYCNAANSWGLRAVELRAPLPAAPASASPGTVVAGASNVSVTLTGTSSGGTGFFDPGAGYSGRISASVGGAGVTVNSVTFTSPTSIALNLSIAPGAAPGARTITVTNPDGQAATSASGILTVSGVSCPTITLAPSTLTNGAAGSPYSQAISASGGTAPYTYAVTAGALPAGVTLSSAGLLSGTPAYGGTYNVTVTATDANFCTGVQAYSWLVTGCPELTLAPSSLPGDTLGQAYSQSVTASGGAAPYAYVVSAGSLPAGITLSAGGLLSGTPSATGTFNFTVQATDANTCVGTRGYSIQVLCPLVALAPSSLPSDTVGKAYSQSVSASGGTGPYAYAVTAGTPPPGLSLSSGGLLSGTSTTAGTYNFTVTATDAILCAGARAYALTIHAVYVPNTVSLAAQGTPVIQQFDLLGSAGNSGRSSLPAGWLMSESGTNSDTIYAADNGTATAGNTYSYGATSASDRAFGVLQSGSLAPLVGASVTNNTGATITALEIAYVGEEWRLGALARRDSLLFQMSLDATSLSTGSWTSYPQLHFATPSITGATGAKDGNAAGFRASVAATLTGLSIANGAEFFIRWSDLNPTGADDGLALDSVALTANPGGGSPTNPSAAGSSSPPSVVVGNTALLTVTVAPGANPASTGITVSAGLDSIGGASSQPFFNDGTNGDVANGDNIWSYRPTVGLGATPGVKSLPVSVADAQARNGSASIGLTVLACPAITLLPASLSDAGIGVPYSQPLTASGAAAPSAFALLGGSLPAGITLSGAGLLSGTATAIGTSNFTVGVTDSNGCTASALYALQVTCPAISVLPDSLPDGLVGAPYNQTVTASGGTAPYAFVLQSGALPAGLSLSAGGVLSGTSLATGISNFTLSATDSNGCTGSKPYALAVVCPAIAITPASFPGATVGAAYAQTLAGTGGTAPYAFSVVSGTPPAGITLLPSGLLSGTPSAAGGYNFTVLATDSNGCEDSLAFSLSVGCPAIVVSPSSLPSGAEAAAYSEQLSASGGTPPYAYLVTTGAPPAGITLSSGGLLSGTPGASGSASFTVTANDSFGCAGVRAYLLQVDCPVITVLPAALDGDSVGYAIDQTLSATGGTGPYAFSVTAGSLPDGVSLASDGSLSGIATGAGSYAFTVTAVDADSCTGGTAYAWQIHAGSQVIISVPLLARWNIISNPLAGGNDSLSALFPTAAGTAYGFDPGSGYVSTPLIPHGAGYWLKFGPSQNATIIGFPLVGDSVPVSAGWNIVGALAEKIAASSVVPVGTDILSQFYGYQSGYVPADSLAPGQGYWVNVTSSGTLVYSPSLSMAGSVPKPSDEALPLASITFSDAAGNSQELFVGRRRDADEKAFSLLPPLPPKGIFDARFASDRMTELVAGGRRQEFSVRIASAEAPVTVRWSRSGGSDERLALLASRGARAPQRIELKGEGSATLESTSNVRLVSEPRRVTPTSYALLQNYPNPFNPLTTIQFDLPVRSSVTLAVLNILGEEVARLHDKAELGPGREDVSWDASALPSGIYFCRISARPAAADAAGAGPAFSSTRKMILLR